MRVLMIGLVALLVAGCGAAAPPVTAQAVAEAMGEAGLGVTGIQEAERDPNSPLPNSYDSRVEFTIDEVAPSGGQVFVCRSRQNCDAIYAYYDALKALAGPYLYQSPNGLVVAQLNDGLSPATGEAFKAVIDTYK